MRERRLAYLNAIKEGGALSAGETTELATAQCYQAIGDLRQAYGSGDQATVNEKRTALEAAARELYLAPNGDSGLEFILSNRIRYSQRSSRVEGRTWLEYAMALVGPASPDKLDPIELTSDMYRLRNAFYPKLRSAKTRARLISQPVLV